MPSIHLTFAFDPSSPCVTSSKAWALYSYKQCADITQGLYDLGLRLVGPALLAVPLESQGLGAEAVDPAMRLEEVFFQVGEVRELPTYLAEVRTPGLPLKPYGVCYATLGLAQACPDACSAQTG